MDTRREFLKKTMLLSGAAGWNGIFPESIRKAMMIDPAAGSSYLDAEHVVILMQENRSFDHCFGMLKGVRGFNDPRAIHLPNQNKVWLQSNKAGETYAPFRFDIRDTKITWMGSVPHSRSSQVDACHQGRYDQWLDAKRSYNPLYSHMPLTLGHYTREDLPFNYALADAFTICDQHFASGMTSTWPNRMFLWSGTVRAEQSEDAKAYIRNEVPYGEASWTTFPELLEKNQVSWKVYQNDLSAGGGFSGDERAWLSNFGCNLLEMFTQYHVRFSDRYVEGLRDNVQTLPGAIEVLKTRLTSANPDDPAREKIQKEIIKKTEVLLQAQEELAKWTKENFERLSAEQRNLYQKAFTTNAGDPHYQQLDRFSYEEDGIKRELTIPKGDILYQFREDVNNGKLPAVSWLAGPENFSDHPTAPWYGAWYVSEILDILTRNPEVWKKTIFILTYDENDGYFDHVPPFVAPDPENPESGKCSSAIHTGSEYIRRERELAQGVDSKEAREGPTGLGFRVPMVIASPWTRGGQVCSQVFDHTSVFRFVQEFLNKKMGKQIAETNISLWRKTVCGDLTAAFRPYQGEELEKLPLLNRLPFIETIYNAKFKKEPANFKALTEAEIGQINLDPFSSPWMPHQEPGIKPSRALPYQLYADGGLSDDRKSFVVRLEARNEIFGNQSAGSPFNIYLPAKYASGEREGARSVFENTGSRSYAVIAGDAVNDAWSISAFEERLYHLRIYGPNGFFREHRGNVQDPPLDIRCDYERTPLNNSKLTGKIRIAVKSQDRMHAHQLIITDSVYKKETVRRTIPASRASQNEISFLLDPSRYFGWYDFRITVEGFKNFEKKYAGRVETGEDGFTDPYMGRII
jgi:phospholipase C